MSDQKMQFEAWATEDGRVAFTITDPEEPETDVVDAYAFDIDVARQIHAQIGGAIKTAESINQLFEEIG